MTNPDCEECGGEGYVEVLISVDDTKKIYCECNQPDIEYEPDYRDDND